MLKKLCIGMVAMQLAWAVMAEGNLLPAVSQSDTKSWENARNAICQCEFLRDEANQTMTLNVTSQDGYANFRHTINSPQSGFYTLNVEALEGEYTGRAGVEIFLFDAAGKAIPASMSYLPAGKAKNHKIKSVFYVPENIANIRFGLCMNGFGKITFRAPEMVRSENLLPPVMPEKNKFWIECFNAASKDTSSFRADAAKQSLFITLKGDAGYANYRYVIPTPAAGDYTADIKAVFRSGSKSVGVEVYAFDANNKPKLLAMQFFNGSNVAKTDRMAVSFKVPENCKNVRFGLCLNGDGQAEFIKPALYRGKLSLSELPER